jgi:hypothetical protein
VWSRAAKIDIRSLILRECDFPSDRRVRISSWAGSGTGRRLKAIACTRRPKPSASLPLVSWLPCYPFAVLWPLLPPFGSSFGGRFESVPRSPVGRHRNRGLRQRSELRSSGGWTGRFIATPKTDRVAIPTVDPTNECVRQSTFLKVVVWRRPKKRAPNGMRT